MDLRLKRILPRVQKPARYVGGEYGEIVKEPESVEVKVALCFPDTYEIGMSNLGIRILYGAINKMDGIWCQRVFAPWEDMEREMRQAGIPLYALESGESIGEFDLIGFSLGYEMAYTNVLNMLDLAGLPIRSSQRTELSPIVFAGGTCALNPEPLSDFIDLFVFGEGEDADREVIGLYREAKDQGLSKTEFLERAAQLPGIYVPRLYEAEYDEDGKLRSFGPIEGAPERVKKRIVENLDRSYFPVDNIVPSTEIIHDRVVLEVFRGCVRGCRFCQAGFIYRPVRSKSVEELTRQGVEGLKSSGYQEITLSSLSTSDYRGLGDLCDGMLDWCEPKNISLSLPSLRADNFSMELMERVQKVRKSGLTFAPEAGSQRLRDVINKNVTEEELLRSLQVAFEGGWSSVKLYFMLGLPTETDEDVIAIAELSQKVLGLWKRCATNKSRGVRITVSTSCFVPKPHTPFQWVAQNTRQEYMRKVELLRSNMKSRAITYNWHEPDVSFIEAVLSRGDRRLGAVLERVWETGGKLDSWSEFFDMDRWLGAFEYCGVDPDFYATRERDISELLPWDFVDVGVKRSFLERELEQAISENISPDCRVRCTGCGADEMLSDGRKCDE